MPAEIQNLPEDDKDDTEESEPVMVRMFEILQISNSGSHLFTDKKTEEELIAERLKTARAIPVTESLFDNHVSKDLER